MAKAIHIPLSERQAVTLLGRVKPTDEMPRQGAHATKPKAARPPDSSATKFAKGTQTFKKPGTSGLGPSSLSKKR